MTYLTGWFIIDVVSILPFTYIFQQGNSNLNSLTRMVRLPRLYRLLRLGK